MSKSFALVAVLATLPVIAFAGTPSQANKKVTKQNRSRRPPPSRQWNRLHAPSRCVRKTVMKTHSPSLQT